MKIDKNMQDVCRRAFLRQGLSGLGLVALNSLLNPGLSGADSPQGERWRGVVNPLHHEPKAKRVIFL
jgi:hypothetical protein